MRSGIWESQGFMEFDIRGMGALIVVIQKLEILSLVSLDHF